MKCKECRYSYREDYEDAKGYKCTADMSWVPIDVADDDTWECDLYVKNMDDDTEA